MRASLIIVMGIALVSCNGDETLSDAYGNFQAKEILVSAESNGQLLLFNIELGDKLMAGKQIGLIDTSQLFFNLQNLKARKQSVSTKVKSIDSQLDVLHAEKENLLIEKHRIANLYKDGAATQSQVDNAKGKMDVLNARIESVKVEKETVFAEMKALDAQILQMQDQLQKCKIHNPRQGTVLEKYAEQGEVTAMGRPLYKIADLNHMELKAYMSGAQLDNVKIGQKVSVIIDKSEQANHQLEGTIAWISDQAEFTPKIIQTKDIRVDLVYAFKIHVQNDGKIKIGMPGEVRF